MGKNTKCILISDFLKKHNIEYIPEYTFSDCRYKKTLPFDFALIKDNQVLALIEYDGIQHYEEVKGWGGKDTYDMTRLRDQIKTKYCLDNNIPLIRIPYTQFDSIHKILIKKFYKLGVIKKDNGV